MGEVITFRPKGNDWDQNLADYVQAAKSLPFMAASSIIWNAGSWNLTGLAKPERVGHDPTVTFGTGRVQDRALSIQMGEFARAYVAFKIGEKFGRVLQIGKYTKPVIIMRTLAEVMEDEGVMELAEITPTLLDATVERIRAQGGKDYGIEQRAKALEWVAKTLNSAGVLRSPFDWSAGPKNFHGQSRINKFEDDRNFTQDEIEAVAEAFWKARTPRQQIATSVLAILCSVPGRISEVLELPVDCDVVLDPGDGYQAGLRWWPQKGGIPQIKYVPNAMVPVVQEALARIKRHTDPARALARSVLAGEAHFKKPPDGWPVLPGDNRIPYDRALMIAHPNVMSSQKTPKTDLICPISYHQILAALQGVGGVAPIPSVFDEMGIRLQDGSPLIVNTHKPRHYLNTIANMASVPQADIALWSGRKNIHQNSTYDHETPQGLLARIRKARGPVSSLPIPIDDQTSFDIAQIKETAHTTQFGWCIQSLRQNPCQMFGECLNCTNLVCIKGAEGKLANIKRELERERQLYAKAQQRISAGLRASPRWAQLFESKIARLEQLVSILESEDTIEGSPVFMSRLAVLPQFDPVGPGKDLAVSAARQEELKGDTNA